ncbi:MAG: TIGR00730 family Rossman fold protein [Pseudomonadota bacterium]
MPPKPRLTRPTQSVCVYCGSKPGSSRLFTEAAHDLGVGLAERGYRLVYGAGDHGLMGEVARATLDAGGEAVGVIPRGLWDREVGKRDLTHLVITENLQQRKTIMLENADAAVVLPGGIGTLDEMVEAMCWRQLGLHAKPVVLLDIEGYWQPFITLLDRMHEAGFLYASARAHLHMTENVDDAFEQLATVLSASSPE